MTCADAEILVCEYAEGMLHGSAKAELEQHLAACRACSELARDAAAALDFMSRAAEVEPPPELIGRVLMETQSGRHGRLGYVGGWMRGLLQPLLRPRLVMSMAMTIFSFAMLARLIGLPERQITAADLKPASILMGVEDRAWRAWQRTVKYYESLRFVYQIQSRLREWREQAEEEQKAEEQDTESRRLPAAGAPAAREQNKPEQR